MGAILHEGGVAFRVWAPHAEEVSVIGDFNRWNARSNPLESEDNGYWYGNVPEAKVGQGYRFWLQTPNGELTRIDPYARAVTNSIGNGVIHDPNFDWEGDDFHINAWNSLVIYEMHIGSFANHAGDEPVGTFELAMERIEHIKRLGVNAVQLMPVAEFAGDLSWGYNPSHIFAVESAYGGPDAMKEFIKELHKQGIAVILDVVYNHFGPSDLDIWRFDGWYENDGGGIYFYQDWRSLTPWGHSRPDYGRGEVRSYIHDNAMMWLEEYHIDGLRYDGTVFIRRLSWTEDKELPEGWTLLQWINGDVATRFPGRILIAEDLQNNEWLTKPVPEGGAGFNAQWDAAFVHPIRAAVIATDDAQRSMPAIAAAISLKYNNAAFQRVIYSESHDEVANGKARVPQEISPNDPTNFFAQKRSTLAAALVFTAPGIPMLFQGQEFLQGEWFRDDVPLDWDLNEEYRGIVRLYRDLVYLRLNRQGFTRGLTGQNLYTGHVNDANNVIAFRRWEAGGPGDDTMIVVNFTNQPKENYQIGFPAEGVWRLRFNSDAQVYSQDFAGFKSLDVTAKKGDYDGLPATATVNIGPYSALIFSQDPPKKA
ncbi:MAG: alpha amylase C-terminal domain-containing protein [Caldilineaceae bacterium]|nr:alpha amylase C-terminal domain-containing protein [Caldilineaceae bacterium]